ncbi:sn-glycerol-3-phosphate ABC transporter ATP-binding protein UgpC [Rhodococcus erythropolis]|uniref:ABC transporter ATP-binding protein n=1 Tax=Rhodococcus erythropolis TaxID=1833 RepID=UPI0012921250|nr:sn-glycerol-3-phosphate ABC transporter ATP-binding protein UgpC [Rhodococcus erythropolis]MQP33480.1 sn-glycerol-3-phosphate ABC transporter ATP-binding protein UgpC [Rhodococcus erythropolis]
MASVEFDNVTFNYDRAARPAVNALNLELRDGEFLAVVGPSGCGKSTTLRMLAGLEKVSTGRIRIDGRDVTELAPSDRDIAMVFQSYALYPHMSVADNMAFALRVAGVSKSERSRRVTEAAAMLGLEPYLNRKPRELSGGQRQRVAMGRAIVREPKVFCMDEPLSNLDAKLRTQTRTQIAELQRRLGTTTLFVTHDQTEAMTLGDRVAVLRDGELQQCDTPERLYTHPANTFVAGFIGSPAINLLPAVSNGDRIAAGDLSLPTPRSTRTSSRDGRFEIGVRPEDFSITGPSEGIAFDVDTVEINGPDAYLTGTVAAGNLGTRTHVTVRTPARPTPPRGRIHIRVAPNDIHLFEQSTGLRIAQ